MHFTRSLCSFESLTKDINKSCIKIPFGKISSLNFVEGASCNLMTRETYKHHFLDAPQYHLQLVSIVMASVLLQRPNDRRKLKKNCFARASLFHRNKNHERRSGGWSVSKYLFYFCLLARREKFLEESSVAKNVTTAEIRVKFIEK